MISVNLVRPQCFYELTKVSARAASAVGMSDIWTGDVSES